MRNLGLGFLVLSLFGSITARAEYEVYESTLELSNEKIEIFKANNFNRQKDETYVPDSPYEESHFMIGSVADQVPSGYIHLKEFDIETGKTKITRILVKVAICQTGVNLCASVTSGTMGIRFVSGKKISDLVGPTFGGGSVRVAALLNLGASYWKNGAGIYITDFETLGAGIGFKGVDTKLVLSAPTLPLKNVTVTDEEGVEVQYTMKEAMNFKIGH